MLDSVSRAVVYPVALVDRVAWVREPQQPRRGPALTPRALRTEAELSDSIQRLLREDPEWKARSREIARIQARVRRRSSEAAWRAYLELEERDVARWHYALLVVARWAFANGKARR